MAAPLIVKLCSDHANVQFGDRWIRSVVSLDSRFVGDRWIGTVVSLDRRFVCDRGIDWVIFLDHYAALLARYAPSLRPVRFARPGLRPRPIAFGLTSPGGRSNSSGPICAYSSS